MDAGRMECCMVEGISDQGAVFAVGHLGGLDPNWEVIDPDEIEQKLAERGAAVVLLAPSVGTPDLKRRLADIDPLAVLLDADPVAPGELRRLVVWGLAEHISRTERRIHRAGGAMAGEFACRSQDELVGGGEAMSGFRNRLRQVAEHDVATLIHGPQGTPLAAAARWLHVSSNRRDAAFVPVNCCGCSESQLLVRIFGHGSGAFPGADSAEPSAMAVAGRGSVLIHGLEHAHRSVQERILEMMRDKEWRSIGSHIARPLISRIIVTLHRAPLQAIMEGSLYRDLLDRLSGHIVRMPSLLDRSEDIPDLMSHYLTQAAAAMGRRRPTVEPDLAGALVRARWIGQDRELELVCERLVLSAVERNLCAADVEGWLAQPGSRESGEGLVCTGDKTLADVERSVILATLRAHNGHRRRSAAALGIGVRTLGLKLRRWKDAAIVPETV